MEIIDYRMSSTKLPLTSEATWLDYVLPNTRNLEMNKVYFAHVPKTNGLITSTEEAYVAEYLVWFHNEREPRPFYLRIKNRAK